MIVQRSLIYLLYRALLGMWWGIMQDQNEPMLLDYVLLSY